MSVLPQEKLGNVCKFVRGPFGGSLRKDCFKPKGYAVYEQQHAIYDQFTDVRYYVDEEKFKEMQRFELLSGDLIMSCSGTMGKVAIVPNGIERGIINQALLKLTPKSTLNVEYLKYWMESVSFSESISKHSKGAAIKNVASVKVLKDIKLPFPPLPEQERIVAQLDAAFAAIEQAKANVERNLQNAKELFQSKLNEVFSQKGDGWVEKKLGAACEIAMGQSPKGTSYNDTGEGVPLINGPVEFGKGPFSKTIKSKFTTSPTKMCKEGDMILCVRGSTTGRINIAGFEACIGRGVASIRFEDNQVWLNYFIRAKQQEIYDLGTGATFPNVSGKMLSEMSFPIPPSEVQHKLVIMMEALDTSTGTLQTNYTQKLTELDDLKKSLLERAFRGEI